MRQEVLRALLNINEAAVCFCRHISTFRSERKPGRNDCIHIRKWLEYVVQRDAENRYSYWAKLRELTQLLMHEDS
jgi:hypothetical protein